MKLYELTDEFKKLEEMAESIECQDDANAFTTLWDEINLKFEEKAEKTAFVIKNLKAEADAIKIEEERLRSRRKTLESSADNLKCYVENHMINNGIQKINGKLFTLMIQKNPAALKYIEEQLPNDLFVIKREPNTQLIKEQLKNGIHVQGAWLENGQSLRIK